MKHIKKFQEFVNENQEPVNEYGKAEADKTSRSIEKAMLKVKHENQVQREFKQSILSAINTYIDESPDEMEETMKFMTILFNEIKMAH